MNIKILFLFSILILTKSYGQKEEDWQLKSNKEGIAVYCKPLQGSKYKSVKVICTLPYSLSQIVWVLFDIKTSPEWVYSTKSCVVLTQVSPLELVYYSEVSIPWPVSNRDFVAHLKAVQDPHTKVVTIDGPAIVGYMPVKQNVVRVTKSEGKWVITPVARNVSRIEYTLHVDPGGSVPAWLINLFAAKGPYESFKRLKAQLKKTDYKNVKIPIAD